MWGVCVCDVVLESLFRWRMKPLTDPPSRCAFFKFIYFFLALWSRPPFFFFLHLCWSSVRGAVSAELETWLKTFKANLTTTALRPSTPDFPTRTRPGTAGPTTWVRLPDKVKPSPHVSQPSKWNWNTQSPPVFCSIMKVFIAVCTWLLELFLPSPDPGEVWRPLNLGLDLDSWQC